MNGNNYTEALEQIENKIALGTLKENEALPPDIAAAFGIPLSSAQKCVQILLDKGLIYEKQGEGMFIARGAAAKLCKGETSVKKDIAAKDLFIWSKGEDDYGIEVLTALNKIIDGLNELGECGEWEDIAERVDWRCANVRVAENCDKIYDKDELFEMADNFAAVRILLFGDKIDYGKLLEMLKSNVEECGWTKEKAAKRREEREKCRDRLSGSSEVFPSGERTMKG